MAFSPSRRTLWSLVLVVALANVPMLMSLATQARIASSGTAVTASVVGGRVYGDEAEPEYWLSYRFDPAVDERKRTFSAEVDRSTYTRARQTRQVAATVVPGDPVDHRVAGEQPRRLGLLVTLALDALVLLAVAVWWLRRRPAGGQAADPVTHSGP